MRPPMPSRLEFALRNYPRLTSVPVLDVGCGLGRQLARFGPGSVGLDGRAATTDEGRSVLQWNFDDDIVGILRAANLEPFEYVWCSDVFEHHPAPHLFLLNLRRALAEEGVLFLGVPLVNWLGRLPVLRGSSLLNYFRGFQSQDHVNFFRMSTLLPTVQFAGFRVESWYSPFLPLRRPPMIGLEPITVLALRRISQFNYGPKAYKVLDADGNLKWKELSSYSTREIPK